MQQRWYTWLGGLPEDEEAARQLRMYSLLSVVAIAAATTYSFVNLFLGMYLSFLGTSFGATTTILNLLAFRKHKNIRPAAHILGFAVLATLAIAMFDSGSTHSSANAWLPLVPVVPAMILGRRALFPWVGATMAWMVVPLIVTSMGLAPASSIPSAWQEIYPYLVFTGFVPVLGIILYSYELTREVAMNRIQEAQALLSVAKSDAESARDAARSLLASVSDGLILVSPSGVVSCETSQAAEAMLGKLEPGSKLWEVFARHDATYAEWLELGWMDLADGLLPPEIVLFQLPGELHLPDRELEISFVPRTDETDTLLEVLVVVRDVTAALEAERAQQEQQELMLFFLRLQSAPDSVETFLGEARMLVQRISAGGSHDELKRWVHTLKGDTASFGLDDWARWLHSIEDSGNIDASNREAIARRWHSVEERIRPLFEGRSDIVTVPRVELDAVLALARSRAPHPQLEEALLAWTWTRVESRLDELADRARREATKAGRDNVQVEVQPTSLLLPPDQLMPTLWASLVHVLRNAIDHGIETAEDRMASGKSPMGTIKLCACSDEDRVRIGISDDGRGVDWERIAEIAAARGLPHDTHDHLVNALFSDGLTTRDAVTVLSGRGVGAAAVKEEVESLGGAIVVTSELGRGTHFELLIPLAKQARQAG